MYQTLQLLLRLKNEQCITNHSAEKHFRVIQYKYKLHESFITFAFIICLYMDL